MKKQYIKPDLQNYQVANTPLMDASFGEGNADPDGIVLSKDSGYMNFVDDSEEDNIFDY